MFGGEIATAFVRIKPNMTGFKAETESGVKGAFSKVAKIVGLAFGARAAYEIAKSSVDAAALIQKQLEVVRAQFGQAGQSLIDFANQAGTSLGAVNTDTLAASARFGILFQNLGIGPRLAAQMTKGFEQLALATNAIKGGSTSDAAQLLNVLSKGAATGRGLNQLGVGLSSVKEQVAAFKLGLIQTVNQALTPGQKAIAIYAIATEHLGDRLRLARANSHDFADVQAQLTAEWAKAKEALGSALLPEIKKVVSAFSGWLSRMEKSGKLQKDFNAFGKVAAQVLRGIVGAVQLGVGIWQAFSKAVGGSKNAVMILLGVMTVSKFAAIGKSVVGLAKVFSGPLKLAMNLAKVEYAVMAGTMTAETEALALTIKASLISTGIGALVVAIGIAAAFIITHWDQVKRWTYALGQVMGQIWRGLKEIIVGAVKVIGGGIVDYLIFPMKEFIDVAAKATGWIPYLGDGVNKAASAVDGLFNSMKNLAINGKDQILQGGKDIGQIGTTWSDAMARTASDPAQKKKLKDAGKSAGQTFADGLNGAVLNGTSATQQIALAYQNAVNAANKAIATSITSAKNNLVKVGDDLAKTIDQIQAKIGGAAGAIAGSPQGQAFAKLKKLIESGAPDFKIQRAQQELSSQLQNVGKSQQSVLKTQLDNLTAAFNKHNIGYSTFESRLHEILHKNGITLKEALKAGGPAFADSFKAQVKALGEQAQAIAAIPAKYRNVGGAGGAADIKIIRPLEVIRNETLRIASAAAKQRDAMLREQAKTNTILDSTKQVIKRLPHSAPGFGKQPKGNGSHEARKGAKVGNRG